MKIIISMLLCLATCISFASIAAQANDFEGAYISNADTTEYISPDDQLSSYLERTDLTPTQRENAISKHNMGQYLANGGELVRIARSTSNTLSVPWYSQEESYYCGPATVKQTIHYINGISDTQDEIADDLGTSANYGTDTNNMCTYLNNNTDYSYEVLWWWADASAFSNMVISDTDDDKPIIGHVIISTKGDWPYTTGGHYINYNGYSSSGETFNVTDPYVDRFGDTDGKYTITNDEAERVTDRIIW